MLNCTATCDRCEAKFQGDELYHYETDVTEALELAGWEIELSDSWDEPDIHYCNSCAAVRADEEEQEQNTVYITAQEYGFWPFMEEYGIFIIIFIFALLSFILNHFFK